MFLVMAIGLYGLEELCYWEVLHKDGLICVELRKYVTQKHHDGFIEVLLSETELNGRLSQLHTSVEHSELLVHST